MRKTILTGAFFLSVLSINAQQKAVEGQFGEKIDTANAISTAELDKKMNSQPEMSCVVKGKVAEVCQAKGCWLKLENKDESIMVRMKDHSFFVPKDISGKTIYLEGVAYRDTISVDMLRHYATDAGKSEKEILAITEPEANLVFEAKGVVLMKEDEPAKK